MKTITIKSFLVPDAPMQGFALGRPFEIHLTDSETLRGLIQRLFPNKWKHLGLLVINEEIASEDSTLSEGDRLVVLPLLEGG